MGKYIRRHPRRVLITTAIALVFCMGVVVVYEVMDPQVGRAVQTDRSHRPSLLQRSVAQESAVHANPLTLQKVAQQTDPVEVAAEPAPVDPVLDYMSEVLPELEAMATPLAKDMLATKAAYESGGDIVGIFLDLLATTDADTADPAVPIAAELGSRLFRTMTFPDIEALETRLPAAEAITAEDGLYTSAASLYILKARGDVAKAFGDEAHEIEYRSRFVSAVLEVVEAHFDDPGPYSGVNLVELLREHRNAVEALAALTDVPADLGAIHETLLLNHTPNLVTWTLHAWLAYHYATAGQDHDKAVEHAEAMISESEAPFVLAAVDDANIDAEAKAKLELLLGRAYHYAGRYAEAERQCAWVVAEYPDTVSAGDAGYFGAMAVYAASDYVGVAPETAFQSFLDSRPDSGYADQARLSLSNLYVADGNPAAAVAVLRAITDKPEASPVEAKALAQLGMVHSMMGDEAAAIPVFERVVTEYPDSSRAGEALTRLSQAKTKVEGIDAGIAVYADYLAAHPDGALRELAVQEEARLAQQRDLALEPATATE